MRDDDDDAHTERVNDDDHEEWQRPTSKICIGGDSVAEWVGQGQYHQREIEFGCRPVGRPI